MSRRIPQMSCGKWLLVIMPLILGAAFVTLRLMPEQPLIPIDPDDEWYWWSSIYATVFLFLAFVLWPANIVYYGWLGQSFGLNASYFTVLSAYCLSLSAMIFYLLNRQYWLGSR